MNKSLFTISKEAMELASFLEENELNPELETTLAVTQQELQEKAVNYAYAIKSLESDVSVVDEEIKRLQAIKKAKNNAIDRMKSSVVNAMGIFGMDSIKYPTITLSIRHSEAVEVVNQDQLPDSFLSTKVTVTPDKTRIKAAIKAGEIVEGAVLVSNQNLQIK